MIVVKQLVCKIEFSKMSDCSTYIDTTSMSGALLLGMLAPMTLAPRAGASRAGGSRTAVSKTVASRTVSVRTVAARMVAARTVMARVLTMISRAQISKRKLIISATTRSSKGGSVTREAWTRRTRASRSFASS